MRLAIYTDYPYHRIGGEVYAERAFAVFLSNLAPHFEGCTVVGRLTPRSSRARYPLGSKIEFVPLPFYPTLSQPVPVLRALAGSIRRFWRLLDEVDCVWLLGPHPFALVFAVLAGLRGKRVALGVRQDLPEYARNRHPGNVGIRVASRALEASFRALGRLCPVVAVGPQLARNYRHSRRLLTLTVSLVDERQIVPPDSREDDYAASLAVLSVGRLDAEKNPLLLAEALALLESSEPGRWRLVVCGEGPLAQRLEERLAELRLSNRAELRGYLPHDELARLYRECSLLLHVSWTEGLPQVLFEAFAAALPAVATDVGGVAEACGAAVSLIPAGDAEAATAALRELAADALLRRERVRVGNELARAATLQSETQRTAAFLVGP